MDIPAAIGRVKEQLLSQEFFFYLTGAMGVETIRATVHAVNAFREGNVAEATQQTSMAVATGKICYDGLYAWRADNHRRSVLYK